MRAEILPSMMSRDSSFSRAGTLVFSASAMVLRFTDTNGLKYWIIALERMLSNR